MKRKYVVVAPHCDDEIVGTGSMLYEQVTDIIYVTVDPARYEQAEYFCETNGITPHFLFYNDGKLIDLKEEERIALVQKILDIAKGAPLLVPSPIDRNSDHTVLGALLGIYATPNSMYYSYTGTLPGKVFMETRPFSDKEMLMKKFYPGEYKILKKKNLICNNCYYEKITNKKAIDVILCSKNRNDSLVFTLKSLADSSDSILFNIIIPLDSDALLPRQEEILYYVTNIRGHNITFVDNKNGTKRTGLSKGMELLRGVGISIPRPILICDDDFDVQKQCVDKMLESLLRNEKVGVVEAMHPTYDSPTLTIDGLSYPFNDPSINLFRHDFFYDGDTDVGTLSGGGMILLRKPLTSYVMKSMPDFAEDRRIMEQFQEDDYYCVSRTGAVVIHLGVKQSHFQSIYDKLPPKNNFIS